jgi:hypothetical protein
MTGEKKKGDDDSERNSSLNVPFLHFHSSSGNVVALVLHQPQIVADDCLRCVHNVLLKTRASTKTTAFFGEEDAA